MAKANVQEQLAQVGQDRLNCRKMMLTVAEATQMTGTLRKQLVAILRQYDKLLSEQQKPLEREVKSAARARRKRT